MTTGNISDQLRQFIFDSIDSVEQIDVLLFIKIRNHMGHSAKAIAQELRTSVSSVTVRLKRLRELGLIETVAGATADVEEFIYKPKTSQLDAMVQLLEEAYRVRRHSVLDLIFSTAKRARAFADAFRLSQGKVRRDGEGENG